MEGDVDGSIMQTTVRFLTFTLKLLPSFSTWKRLAGINKLRLRDSRGQGGKLRVDGRVKMCDSRGQGGKLRVHGRVKMMGKDSSHFWTCD